MSTDTAPSAPTFDPLAIAASIAPPAPTSTVPALLPLVSSGDLDAPRAGDVGIVGSDPASYALARFTSAGKWKRSALIADYGRAIAAGLIAAPTA